MAKEPLITKDVQYKFWKDSKMVGTILLLITVSLQLFAFLRVPGLTSINSYSIGMLFGIYNPFFYMYLVYISLLMIFKDTVKLPSWIKLSKVSYWFVAISVVFFSRAIGANGASWTKIGPSTFINVQEWWNEGMMGGSSDWCLPASNGGLIGATIYSFASMMFSGIGAFIASILLLFISGSLLITGTSIGLYKDMLNKKKIDLTKDEIQSNENMSFDNFSEVSAAIKEAKETIQEPEHEESISKSELQETKKIELDPDEILDEIMPKEIKEENNLPFEDPFE